jgi:hypothetical protein
MSQYATVFVVALRHAPAPRDPFNINRVPPQVGDRGAVVEILHAPGQPDRYVVECVDASGETLWLGEFSADELALVPSMP